MGLERDLVVKPRGDDAAIIDLGSALGGGWKHNLGMGMGCLKASPVWIFGREKWWAENLGIGTTAGKNEDGLLVCESGWGVTSGSG